MTTLRRGLCAPFIIAVVGSLLTLDACSQPAGERTSEAATAVAPPAVELPIPVKVGMTWDESLPFLKKAKRVKNTRDTRDRFTDVYRIGDQGYSLRFERPAEPATGPYRLVRIERAELPPDAPLNLKAELKRSMSMGDALPIMEKIGGHFVVETRDRFVAVLEAPDGTYRVIFERPGNVSRPDVIADATPSVIAMMGRIPLNALPEFTEYRITAVSNPK